MTSNKKDYDLCDAFLKALLHPILHANEGLILIRAFEEVVSSFSSGTTLDKEEEMILPKRVHQVTKSPLSLWVLSRDT